MIYNILTEKYLCYIFDQSKKKVPLKLGKIRFKVCIFILSFFLIRVLAYYEKTTTTYTSV